MGKKSYTQPEMCAERGSISVTIEWEGRHGDPAGEGAGPTVHEESISQRRMLLDSHLPLTKQAMIIG